MAKKSKWTREFELHALQLLGLLVSQAPSPKRYGDTQRLYSFWVFRNADALNLANNAKLAFIRGRQDVTEYLGELFRHGLIDMPTHRSYQLKEQSYVEVNVAIPAPTGPVWRGETETPGPLPLVPKARGLEQAIAELPNPNPNPFTGDVWPKSMKPSVVELDDQVGQRASDLCDVLGAPSSWPLLDRLSWCIGKVSRGAP